MRYVCLAGSLLLTCLTVGMAQQTSVPVPVNTLPRDHTPLIPHGLMGTKDFRMTLRADNGDVVRVEQYHGRPVLLCFWASWWKPSVETLQLIQVTGRYAGDMGVVVLAVDREHQPGTGDDFLVKHQVTSVRNYHFDPTKYDSKLIAGLGGSYSAPEFLLIDSEGTVVYQNSPLYSQELRVAIRGVVSYAPAERPPIRTITLPEPVKLMGTVLNTEEQYGAKQADYVCTYSVRSAGSTAGGYAANQEQHTDMTFFLHGGKIDTAKLESNGSVLPDSGFSSVQDTYRVWDSPLLRSIQQHSILSNEGLAKRGDQPVVRFTVRGDPTFMPKTDVDRIAQSLQGQILIDEVNHVFTFIDLTVQYDVIDGDRFLVQHGLPILEYDATVFDKVYLPHGWSVSQFQTVSTDAKPTANRAWSLTLHRIFVKRDSCGPFAAPPG